MEIRRVTEFLGGTYAQLLELTDRHNQVHAYAVQLEGEVKRLTEENAKLVEKHKLEFDAAIKRGDNLLAELEALKASKEPPPDVAAG